MSIYKTDKHKAINQTLINSLGLFALMHINTANASLVINEVDYDQPGADTAEFIELYNNGSQQINLDNYQINLINGNNNGIYRNIDLTGFLLQAQTYFVICNDPSQVQNCNFTFTNNSGWLQNGSADAVALYDDRQTLIDSLSYEGELFPYTEGNALTVSDSNSIVVSLSRLVNGLDTNNNNEDFSLSCQTPGSANIAGSGDCSLDAVNAVPIPASVWLFGSGLLGLLRLGRMKTG